MESWLAWQKVRSEIDAGTLGPEFEKPELDALSQQVRNAEDEAVDEVWASYRFVSLYDSQTPRTRSGPSTSAPATPLGTSL